MARSGYLPLTAAVIFTVGAAGMACTRNDKTADDRDRNQTAMASPSPSGTVTDDTATARNDNDRVNSPDAGDIAGSPAKYDGQHVTLKADVKKVMPNGFFQLDDHDLLVLSPSGEPMENQKVTVSGTVQTYSAPEFKKRFSWFKSNANSDREYKNRAVVVADSIMTADGRELVNNAALPASSGEPGIGAKSGSHKRDHAGHGNTPADSSRP